MFFEDVNVQMIIEVSHYIYVTGQLLAIRLFFKKV